MPVLTLANGAKVAYDEAGAGPALVLVHGSPAEGRAWGRVARHLPGFRLLTPDLPGSGGSDPPANGAGTAAMAEAVAAVIDRAATGAGAGPVWLAGHSYGGNVALHAAISQRAAIRGVILFEPVFFRGLALTGERRELAAARAHFDDYVRRVAAGEHGAVRRMVEFWFGPGAFERLPAPVRDYVRAAAVRNAADVTAAFSESVSAEALSAFDARVLVAHGERSPPVVPAIAAALAALLPRAETALVPGAGHGMLDTHPEAVAALIARMAAA